MMIDPYASGVLKKEVHERLVADIATIAGDGGIQPHWIWTPIGQVCNEDVVQWVKRFRFHAPEAHAGLILVGEAKSFNPEAACAAIAGALIRHFVRARVTTLNELIITAGDDRTRMMSCLLVPNFFVAGQKPGSLPQWRVSLLHDALITRANAGLQTVLYVSSMSDLGHQYGVALMRHLDALYTKAGVL
jgi:hypothetical protein